MIKCQFPLNLHGKECGEPASWWTQSPIDPLPKDKDKSTARALVARGVFLRIPLAPCPPVAQSTPYHRTSQAPLHMTAAQFARLKPGDRIRKLPPGVRFDSAVFTVIGNEVREGTHTIRLAWHGQTFLITDPRWWKLEKPKTKNA